MLEVLVHPYRHSVDEAADHHYALLASYPHLEWIPLTLPIADRAARLRAAHNLRTPDAIQIATAIDAKATLFVTNDAGFRRVHDIEVVLLDDVR